MSVVCRVHMTPEQVSLKSHKSLWHRIAELYYVWKRHFNWTDLKMISKRMVGDVYENGTSRLAVSYIYIWQRVENGAKKSQNASAFTRYRIEIVWKSHFNRPRDLSETIPKPVRDENGTLGGVNPVLFHSPTFLISKHAVTLTAFRVIFFALLFEKFEVEVNSC